MIKRCSFWVWIFKFLWKS